MRNRDRQSDSRLGGFGRSKSGQTYRDEEAIAKSNALNADKADEASTPQSESFDRTITTEQLEADINSGDNKPILVTAFTTAINTAEFLGRGRGTMFKSTADIGQSLRNGRVNIGDAFIGTQEAFQRSFESAADRDMHDYTQRYYAQGNTAADAAPLFGRHIGNALGFIGNAAEGGLRGLDGAVNGFVDVLTLQEAPTAIFAQAASGVDEAFNNDSLTLKPMRERNTDGEVADASKGTEKPDDPSDRASAFPLLKPL